MNPTQLKREDEKLQILKMIEGQIPDHHLFHQDVCILIRALEDLFTRNKGAMELPELKEKICRYWAKYSNGISEMERFLRWYSHFIISKKLIKQCKEDNLKPNDLTGEHGYTRLRSLKDINEYYAVAGMLMALKEMDVANIIGCTKIKLVRMLEKQIPIYYKL